MHLCLKSGDSRSFGSVCQLDFGCPFAISFNIQFDLSAPHCFNMKSVHAQIVSVVKDKIYETFIISITVIEISVIT